MTVYYEDENIIVCEKPYGFSSQESSGENMISLLKSYTGCDVFCVHRLDVQTTGIMVYAKSKQSAASLSEQIAKREFSKVYLALCHGALEKRGEMTDILYHDKLRNKSFVVNNKRNGAKEARLEYSLVNEGEYKGKRLSLVKIELHTGRTHQIRVQFSSRGFMLYGDGKYGAKDNDKIALHSYKISFFHPITKEKISFSSLPTGEPWDTILAKEQTI